MKLTDIIVADAIVPNLAAGDRDGALREMVEALAATKRVSAKHVDEILKSMLEREKQSTTGFGKGIATPHARVSAVDSVAVVVGRSAAGIDFNSLDRKPVHCIFMVVSPPPDTPANKKQHLDAMDVIFRLAMVDAFRKFVRQAESKQAILDLIREQEVGRP